MTSKAPNLFNYATSELSQDAVICWLLEWADPINEKFNGQLHSYGKKFLISLLEKCNQTPPEQLKTIKIYKQYKNIDVLLVINDNHCVVIEDKTNTAEHSGQLDRYKQLMENDFNQHKISFIYFKTGVQLDYSAVTEAGYSVYTAIDFIDTFKTEENKFPDGILKDYYQYLNCMIKETKAYQSIQVKDWSNMTWKGFFTELNQHYGDLNLSGYASSQGCYFHWQEHEKISIGSYLRISQNTRKLSIKLESKNQGLNSEDIHKFRESVFISDTNNILRKGKNSGKKNTTLANYHEDFPSVANTGFLDMTQTKNVIDKCIIILNTTREKMILN